MAITKLKKPITLKMEIETDGNCKVTKTQFTVTKAAKITLVISLPQGP